MKKLLASLALASLMLASPALAQPASPGAGNPPAAGGPGYGPGPRGGYGWGPGMMMGPGMIGPGMMGGNWGGMCDPRAAGMAEWRMERINQLITPTETQRAALNDLRTASTKAAEIIAAACPKEYPASATARMELMEKRVEAMLTAVKTVRPAFDAFYATLSDEQKARVNSGGPRHWGWRNWRSN